ncbi:MAG: 2-phosphosulfolactate phosphatase [Saprospiraceae bacterium]|nr:2-phosphosulfolactate phosphatase [Saprospiraceae bacterium]
MPRLEVCLTPAILDVYDLAGKNVIVTDVLRATSTMVAGMQLGVDHIRPVSEVSKALEYVGVENTLVAGERNGVQVEAFHLGNSPRGWMSEEARLKGKAVVMSTTNGTKAINMALGADKIYIGAFLNLDAVCKQVAQEDKDVLVVCAGWKNRINMEDSLFGGAVAQRLSDSFEIYGDAALMMRAHYITHRDDLYGAIRQGTHFKRLANHGVEDDIQFCMQENITEVVPYYSEGVIIQ